ncbi:hypothetical protein AB0D14_00775 [Streptomyces sp. NPDC048484]|uniref:hypothetical protein n=1 Tax=Streptomyces sp. NPDC048484 TaxID=3155146 RepID=UPI00344997EE
MLEPGEPNAERRAESQSLGRRRLLGLTGGAALLLTGCGQDGTAGSGRSDSGSSGGGGGSGSGGGSGGDTGHGARLAAPEGVLGANFNEEPRGITAAVLDDLRTKWVRGFVAMPDLDTVEAPRQPAISSLLSFAGSGYGTVLSLKFPYQSKPLPQPGTSAMDTELARVDKVLDAVLDKVSLLVIGNEPFFETRKEDRATLLNPFYKAVAAHVIAERKKRYGSDCRTSLYMGALNRLEDPDWRTPAVDGWLAHVKATPEIEGVDIHPHVTSLDNAEAYTDYVLPRIRSEQRFLATEFSLVRWWKLHWNDSVPAVYASRYGVPADTPVWQEARDAAAKPVSQRRWRDLLMNSRWFASREDYLTDQVEQFRATGRLAVATYGALQQPPMVRDIGRIKPPWLLNSLYANLVAQPSANGDMAHNPAFFDTFRALQDSSAESSAESSGSSGS